MAKSNVQPVDEPQINQGEVLPAGTTGPYYTKPTQQVEYEQRLARENGDSAGAGDLEPRNYAVEDNDLDGYVGVNPEYMTYANDTEAPAVASEGAESVIENRLRDAPAGVVGAVSEPVKEDDDTPKPQDGEVPSTGPADQSGAADQGQEKGAPARD